MTQVSRGVVKDFTVTGNSTNMARSGTTVTVTTSAPHNLLTGDKVTITVTSGGNNNFKQTDESVTVTGNNTFTYTVGNNAGTASGTYTFDPVGSLLCPANTGFVRSYTQAGTRTETNTASVTSTTVTASTSTVLQTKTYTFAKLRTIVSVNGTVTNDTTSEAPGVLAGTVSQPAVVTAIGTPVTTTESNPSNSDTTTWGAATMSLGTSCVSTTTAGPTVTPGASTTTTTMQTTTPVVTGPTNQTPVLETPIETTSTEGAKSTTQLPDVKNGGTENTLADVAMYYYMTDLRTSDLGNCTGSDGFNVCDNNVRKSDGDPAHSYGDNATWQHMTTFTVGLGVNGQLKYKGDYFNDVTSDFLKILAGDIDWPSPVAASITSPPANVDDLWHAAVNGRGQYFSADNPTALTDSLSTALTKIDATPGSAAAASTSSLQPVQNDNDIFVAQFTTQQWFGDVLAYQINPSTGNIESTITWSAKKQLDLPTTPSARSCSRTRTRPRRRWSPSPPRN
ncbi:hypothetical protein HK414_03260 [Ramlibacter terrae]|uniref:Uncharacterized protein n=1 Tax=Ramlibacter terrae TaxID=2732511 RepID=A0ABX6P296_9BURK|nr:hypothetical protein HK414_03260 [Ramlibacter terrae]